MEATNHWHDIEARNDAHYGQGRWHCDDLWATKAVSPCVLAFLDAARAPAIEQVGKEQPNLFASYGGKRVRVTMASRFGDVGITEDLQRAYGYDNRVYLPDLTDFAAEAKPRGSHHAATAG